MDGKGYFFKKADTIPFPSRMIAIIDAYSAISMGRVYSAPRTYEETMKIIQEESGDKFDPELVEIFAAIPKAEIEACAPEIQKN